MLVMTRSIGQKIVIPQHGIEIMVTSIGSHGRVRIGITAPKETLVDREEVWLEKQRKMPQKG